MSHPLSLGARLRRAAITHPGEPFIVTRDEWEAIKAALVDNAIRLGLPDPFSPGNVIYGIPVHVVD